MESYIISTCVYKYVLSVYTGMSSTMILRRMSSTRIYNKLNVKECGQSFAFRNFQQNILNTHARTHTHKSSSLDFLNSGKVSDWLVAPCTCKLNPLGIGPECLLFMQFLQVLYPTNLRTTFLCCKQCTWTKVKGVGRNNMGYIHSLKKNEYLCKGSLSIYYI